MPEARRKLGVFPAFHKVEGRRFVVIGGGAEAADKVRLLAETRAEIVVYSASLAMETRGRPRGRPCRLARGLAQRGGPYRRRAGLCRHRR